MNKNIKNRSLLNNSEIARRLGVTPQYIGQVMRGDKPGKKITPNPHIVRIVPPAMKMAMMDTLSTDIVGDVNGRTPLMTSTRARKANPDPAAAHTIRKCPHTTPTVRNINDELMVTEKGGAPKVRKQSFGNNIKRITH